MCNIICIILFFKNSDKTKTILDFHSVLCCSFLISCLSLSQLYHNFSWFPCPFFFKRLHVSNANFTTNDASKRYNCFNSIREEEKNLKEKFIKNYFILLNLGKSYTYSPEHRPFYAYTYTLEPMCSNTYGLTSISIH